MFRVDYAYTANERVYLSISVTVNGSTKSIVSSQVSIVQIYSVLPICLKEKRTTEFNGLPCTWWKEGKNMCYKSVSIQNSMLEESLERWTPIPLDC